MADKTIGQLVAATNVTPTDLFVLEQSGTAKKLTGQILENWLLALADGHGGIQSIAKTGTTGLVDTYTITLADNTTVTFTVTNGKAISSITTYYVTSTSGSTVPSSGWSTTRQSMTSTKRYLWSYQHIAFNDNSSIDTVKTVIGVWGDKGDTGATGRGIVSLSQTSREPEQYTLYTFTMSDGTTETFYSYDGVGITGIAKTSSVGLVDLYTISYSNGTSTDFTVTNAKSITSVAQTGSSGLTDTYTISFNDGTSTTFNVRNGSSISSIEKTSTQGLVDTYTVSLTDGTSTTFTVTNAKSITRIEQTGGTHAAGSTDTYTIYFNDGDTATFSVYNGTNGTGSVSTVDGIQPGGNQNVTLLTTGNGAPTTTTPGNLYQRYFDLSTQILYICIGVDTTTTPNTYSWAGTGVPVDTSLSSSSENPVQNKVITAKVGTAALNTTAQNLSGAVNELHSGVTSLNTTTQGLRTDVNALDSSLATYTRPNLLDNWYFVGGGSQLGYGTFPVNQRGQTTYSGTGYHIDRWANYNITRMDVGTEGVTIVASANGFVLSQNLANPASYAGKTLTATALFSSVSGGTAGVRLAVGGATYSGTDLSAGGLTSVTRTLTSSDDLSSIAFNIRLSSGATAKLVAVKLEIGDSQTLAHQESGVWVLNEIPDYAEELAKCQAYFIKTSLTSEYSCALGIGGTNPRFLIPLPVTMAKTPTFARTGADPFVFGVGSNTVIVGSSSSAIQISGGFSATLFPNGVRVSFQTTDAVGGAFLPCATEVPAFELSAE